MNTQTILIIIGAVVLLWLILAYNGLAQGKNQVAEAWGTIDTQLKRRHDLIPNLIEVVKGYAKHEKETLAAVVAARTDAMRANSAAAAQKAEGELAETLKSIFALAENYPTLKADSSFVELQNELADTETKIQAARQFYNSAVLAQNDRVVMFPSNLVARVFGFKQDKYFELQPGEEKEIKVKF